MKLVTMVRLFPEDNNLLAMIEQFNHACNELSKLAFDSNIFNWLGLQRASYHWLRKEFGLNAAQAVTAVRKVAYAYSNKKNRKSIVGFDARGAIPVYKHSYKRDGIVCIYGLRIPFKARADINLSGQYEAKLKYEHGKFILYQVYQKDEIEPYEPSEWLGCDLGIVNILVDSDGKIFNGGDVEDIRRKFSHRRKNLQKNGSRSSKRKLKAISKKQANFQRDKNHQISKYVVAKAEDTGRGIALEDLKGIRNGITVRKAQRARHSNWSFFQLRAYIEYKAQLMGVPIAIVDPRNTSRKCPHCGNIDKKNRPSQSIFKCTSCGYAGLADVVAAVNIAARARDDAPMVVTYG